MENKPAEFNTDRRFALLAGILLLCLMTGLLALTSGWLVLKILLGILGTALLFSGIFLDDIFTHEIHYPPVSDRLVGTLLALLFLITGAAQLWQGHNYLVGYGLLAGAIASIVLTIAKPGFFTRPANYWSRFAGILHVVMTPVILAVVYFGCFIPMGVAMRLLGKDPLRRTRITNQASYWIERKPPGPDPESIKMQF